jgi:hypothetical protein
LGLIHENVVNGTAKQMEAFRFSFAHNSCNKRRIIATSQHPAKQISQRLDAQTRPQLSGNQYIEFHGFGQPKI